MTEQAGLAAVQMVSGDDVANNLDSAAELVARAAAAGAGLVVLPENFGFLGRRETDKLAVAEDEGDGPMQAFLAEAARRHGLYLVGGTVPLRGSDPARVRAACLVHGPDGSRVARYDKLHLFDVHLEGGEAYRESASLEPGDGLACFDCPLGRVGLSICYDLRFPELYRALVDLGAEILAVPSAFTATTGAAHWELLVRARAVENLCYVVAADQGGEHPTGRHTHGESMVVDPWGRVLARRSLGPGVVQATMERDVLTDLRRRFPALDHRRTLG